MPSLDLENSIVDERYEVRRRLNHGSYAEIFQAFDLERERRRVIIKALNTSLQGTPDPDLERTLVENFQNEAIALDAVRHPNIVRRLGHGTAADLAGTPFHYLVLEYMSGGDLMDLVRKRGALSIGEAAYYFRQVCEALDAAHERGIIHRDVKPSNLLLSENERVIKIIDFGVAKLTDNEIDAEVTRVGTDLYAPPEHHPHAVDLPATERLTPAADIYSLAKTIYTALAGRSPRGFARHPITDLPTNLASRPWGPRLLEILQRATQDAPGDRYATVREFWTDFAALETVEADDDDDEMTQVRARQELRSSGELPPAAPRPRFAPHGDELQRSVGPPRIVVELEPPEPASAGPPPQAPIEKAPKRRATERASATEADEYSYREDLKDLIGSGWRRRAFIAALVFLLFIGVAVIYYEVHRSMTTSAYPTGTVTAPQLNLRDGPSLSSQGIATLPEGTRVRIISQDESKRWYEVEVTEWGEPVPNEQMDHGWVSAYWVALDAAEQE